MTAFSVATRVGIGHRVRQLVLSLPVSQWPKSFRDRLAPKNMQLRSSRPLQPLAIDGISVPLIKIEQI